MKIVIFGTVGVGMSLIIFFCGFFTLFIGAIGYFRPGDSQRRDVIARP